jgi:ADP-glucose pyrophosphorylase
VRAGAAINESLLFEECVIEETAVVDGVIADRGVRFPQGSRIMGHRVFAARSIADPEKES